MLDFIFSGIFLFYFFAIPLIHMIIYYDDYKGEHFITYLHTDDPQLNLLGVLVKRIINSGCYLYVVLFSVLSIIIVGYMYVFDFLFLKRQKDKNGN